MIRRSSSVILVSTRTRISVSLGSIGRLSFCVLSSITGMSLISWFSSPFLSVKIFLCIPSNSTSVSHWFVRMTLAWSTSSYFSPDSNHSFSVSSSSRPALVEASHHYFFFLLCPPPSHHYFNLKIFFLFPLHMQYFVICLHTFLFMVTFNNRFIKTLQCFMYTSFPFSSNPKNHSLSSLSLHCSQPFLLSGWNFPLLEAVCRPSVIGILPLVVMVVAASNSSWGVQPLTFTLSAPLGSGSSPVCQSLRLPEKPPIKSGIHKD